MASGVRHFEVVLTRGRAGVCKAHEAVLDGLGLSRSGKTVWLKDTPAVRGMLYKVAHMVHVTPVGGEPPLSSRGAVRVGRSSEN